MYITFIGFKTKGLRCPDMEIKFPRAGAGRQINLLQMPNGTGKTTIIELIGACLHDVSRLWGSQKVMQYKGNDNDSNSGQFILEISVGETEEESLRSIVFQIDFDFENGLIRYSTNRDPTVGLENGWHAPQNLLPFLNDRCVDVFVFKGDKVNNLLSNDRNDAENSIKAFFNLSSLDDFVDRVEDEYRSRASGPQTDRAVTQRENVLNKWVSHRYKKKQELSSLEQQISEKKALIALNSEKVDRLLARNKDHKDQSDQLKAQKEEHMRDISTKMVEALSQLRNPLFISKNIEKKLSELKLNLDRMKLPGTSGEFFKELAEEDQCVCDREIDTRAKEAILRNASSFLSDNHVVIVNGIKKDISTFTEKADQQLEKASFEKLSEYVDAFERVKQNISRLERKVLEETSQSERELIENLVNERNELKNLEIKEKELKEDDGTPVNEASSRNPESVNSIPVIDKVINLRQEELAGLRNTVIEFNQKERLVQILKNSSINALKSLNSELRDASNEKLKQILPSGSRLEISGIAKFIQIGYEGRLQESGSGAQNVAVAYSFASSILERSGAQFPLIVDHPVTALQEDARRKLAPILSRTCHQFIGFVIDTEKTGLFPALQRGATPINAITIFRDIDGHQTYIKMLEERKIRFDRSFNGVVTYDQQFFEDFKDLGEDSNEDF